MWYMLSPKSIMTQQASLLLEVGAGGGHGGKEWQLILNVGGDILTCCWLLTFGKLGQGGRPLYSCQGDVL